MTLARVISVGGLLLAIVVIGVLFFQVMARFFVPLFLAALLVVIFRPLFLWISQKTGGHPRLASILTTFAILLLVLLPSGVIAFVAAAQGADFFRFMQAGGLHRSVDQIRSRLGLDLPMADEFRRLDDLVERLAEPESLSDVESATDEAGQIINQLTLALIGDGDEDAAADSAEETPAEAEPMLDQLDQLQQSAGALDRASQADDSLAEQDARQEYQQQYWQLRSTQRDWTRRVLGDSVRSQLKLLANPSQADLWTLVAGAQEYLQPRVLPLTRMAGAFLLQLSIDFGILVIALYFFFADGPAMVHTLMRLSPLDDAYEQRLLTQFDQTSRAVVLATVLSAVAQGVAATVGFWLFGLSSLVLLFLATTFLAFIPFLGPAVIWVPAAIYLGAVQGHIIAAVGLVIYGSTVVSFTDNLVRMFVLQGNSQLHPLLALLSVLGGMQVFGPIGILVGPMVVVFLQTLLEMLNSELQGRKDRISQAGLDSP